MCYWCFLCVLGLDGDTISKILPTVLVQDLADNNHVGLLQVSEVSCSTVQTDTVLGSCKNQIKC